MVLRFIKTLNEECTVYETCDHGYIDGYSFGGRLLEKVIFKITISKNQKSLVAEITPNCAAYFEKLNQKKWLKEAVKAALEQDVFAFNEDMKDDDVCLYDTEKSHIRQKFNCPNIIVIDDLDVNSI